MATYVLMHGTGSGGWLWEPVAKRLHKAGHEVETPTLVGVGERESDGGPETNLTTHVRQIVSLIESRPAARVVLVGFSYSGLVAEGVGAAIPDRIAALVLVDALHASKGQCGFDVLPASVAEQARAGARDHGEGWKLSPFPLALVGGIGSAEPGVSASEVEQILTARRGTHPIGTYEEPVTWDQTSLAEVSACHVICTGKPSPAREHFLARVAALRDAGGSVEELPTGHFPMRTMPTSLTAILLRAADDAPSAI